MAYDGWTKMMDEREEFHRNGVRGLNDDGCLALVLVILGYLNTWDYFVKDEEGKINFTYQYHCGSEMKPNPRRSNPVKVCGKLRWL